MKTKPAKNLKDNEKTKKMKSEETNQETPVIQIQTKQIESKKIKFVKGFSISSIKYEKKKKETCTRLFFTQMEARNLTNEESQNLRRMFADSSKTIKEIFLTFPELTENDLKTLEKCFNTNLSSLKSLNFTITSRCSGITKEGLNRLVNIVKRQPSLQKLSFNLNLCETMSDSVCNNLMSTLKRIAVLKKLHLNFRKNCFENDHSPITDKFIENIDTVIQTQNHLEDFICNLSSNKDESGEGISEWKVKNLLASLEQLSSLKNFGYHVRGIKGVNDLQFKQFCGCVKNLKTLKSLDMDFSGSSVSNLGMTAIPASLKQLTSLHTINLNFSSGISITAECVKTLINNCSKLPNLSEINLDLSCCWSINDAAILNVSKALAKMTNLLGFGIRFEINSQITSEGLSNLGKSLQKLESLKKLHLSFAMCQQIKNQDFGQIVTALKKMNSLQNFELLVNDCRQVNGQLLINVLENLVNSKSLEALTLNFEACEITNDHLINIKTAFSKISSLRNFGLNLNGCKIHNDGFQSLIQAITQLTNLRNLVFSCERPVVLVFEKAFLSLKNLLLHLPLSKSILLNFSRFYLSPHERRVVEELRDSFPSKQVFIFH